MTRALALLALAACAPADDAPPGDDPARDVVAEVSAPGPHPVGHRLAEVVYRPPGADADREVPIEVWYPAATADGPRTTYLVAGVAPVEAPLAREDVASGDGPFPVAVYSHGSGGVGMLAYPYAEHLASHGWVVLAPDHVGNTSSDLLFGSTDPFLRIVLHRPADVRAGLDALEDGALGLPAAAVDASSVLLVGHSFGGWTALSAAGAGLWLPGLEATCGDAPDCALLDDPDVRAALAAPGDPRVVAVAPQAPALIDGFAPGALARLDPPTLLMSGARDRTTPDAEQAGPAWEALDGPDDAWLRLPDGAHHSFISTCDDLGPELVARFRPDALEDGCGDDFVPTRTVLPALAAYLVAFGGAHVRGDAALEAVLDAPLHEGITVQRR